jgi:hypothetical protein
MTTCPTRFAEWIAWTSWRPAEAAYRLGCDASYLGRLRKGTRRPGLRLALAIERLSATWPEGPIRVQEWHDADPATQPADAA